MITPFFIFISFHILIPFGKGDWCFGENLSYFGMKNNYDEWSSIIEKFSHTGNLMIVPYWRCQLRKI